MKDRERSREILMDVAVDVAAGALIGAGLYNFALYGDFPVAGFTGIAVILFHLTGLPIGAGTLLLNVPVAFFCFRFLGKGFFLKSVRSMLIVSAFTDWVAPLFPVYTGERILAAVCTGVLCGIGYALIFLRGSSTGGQDFISLSLQKWKPHMALGTIMMILDGAVILLGSLLVFRDMDGLICGGIVTWLLAGIVNQVLYGSGRGRLMLVITEKGGSIAEMAGQKFHLGTTILEGKGGYSGLDKEVVVCACGRKEIHGLKLMIRQMDPEAFTIILESGEVMGEGFQK